MAECAEIARQVGKRIGEELDIPVFLYEHAAGTPERRNLADVRSGEYEGLQDKLARPEWKPDFGPAKFNRSSGATAVGAREFLIAYNINLNTTDRRYANEIAYEIRERGRWKRAGNIEPFYYKGDVVFFEETAATSLSVINPLGWTRMTCPDGRFTKTACSPTSRASAGWWMTTTARRFP
jgi:hypothetical protein